MIRKESFALLSAGVVFLTFALLDYLNGRVLLAMLSLAFGVLEVVGAFMVYKIEIDL